MVPPPQLAIGGRRALTSLEPADIGPTHHGRCDRGTPERKSKRMPISEKTVVQ